MRNMTSCDFGPSEDDIAHGKPARNGAQYRVIKRICLLISSYVEDDGLVVASERPLVANRRL